jgi:hypothetical protein
MEFVLVFTLCLALAVAGVVAYDYWKMNQDDKKL